MKTKTVVRLLLLILFTTALIVFIREYDLTRFANPDVIRSFVDKAGSYGPLAFALLYYAVTMAFISAAAFSVLAGILFGPVLGSILVIVSATASAATSFFIARLLGGDVLRKLGSQSTVVKKMIDGIDTALDKGGFRAFFIMRCLFVPYIPASYAAGLVPRAKARDFILGTLAANAIFSPAFVIFGDSILEGPEAVILAATLIVLVLSVPKLIKRFKPGVADDIDQDDSV